MLFSILICSIEERKEFLDRLLNDLQLQLNNLDPSDSSQIEILTEIDNRELTIGKKRNKLLDKATGEYIAFIDDDDLVSSDYISLILNALETKPDVVGMHLLHFNDGILGGLTYHSLDYSHWYEKKDEVIRLMRYYRNPNHLNPVKREHALEARFPEISMGEDKIYSRDIHAYLVSEVYIKEPIYYYLFVTGK